MIGMIGIVEVLVDHQIEVVMIEEIIEIGIEMIQRDRSRDRYNRYDDRYDRRDRYSRERSRSPGDYNSRGYRGRSNSGSRYQGGGRQPPKKCSFCGKIGHNIEVCWEFQKYLEKIGRQLTKVKDSPSNTKRNDDDSSDKAFVMQSINSLLEDLGLGTESTNY